MSVILERLNSKFQTILEEEIDLSWKDPNSGSYDRQWAEDALYHTIGPLTENPRWVPKVRPSGKPWGWTSPSQPPPGFQEDGPAPRWTPEEVVYAMAGDPNMLFSGRRDDPRSPEYGNKGGSPLFRTARKVARYYSRPNDRQFIADLYSNGFIPLMKMMQPGFDEGRSPFISYAIRNVQSAMEHGTGGTQQSDRATGFQTESGVVGFKGILEKSDPNDIRAAADQVKGKFRDQALHDKHPDNPLGKYSPAFYSLANLYADALEMGDEDRIDAVRSQIRQKIDEVEDENIFIPGASTGMGSAISTPDRIKKDAEGNIMNPINIASMDAPSTSGGDDTAGMAANIMGDDGMDSMIDPETITHTLDIAINHDLGKMLQHIPKYADMAKEWGAKGGKIGGKMGANELRYVIRTGGPIYSNYPGKGTVRANPQIPRESRGWWEPGSDPEIEPIPRAPEGALWHSIWERNGYQGMGPTEISQEMTQEVAEFNKLGIPTTRHIKKKIDKRSGREIQETVSKVAVSNTLRSAVVKLKFIALLERDTLGIGESKINHPLLEEIHKTDRIDREIIAEACDWMCARIERVLTEKAPPGWKKTVEHMKDDEGMDDDKAFALAWSTHNKGGSKPDERKKNAHYAKESKMQPVDALVLDEEEIDEAFGPRLRNNGRGMKIVTVERKPQMKDSIISVSDNGREVFRGPRHEWNARVRRERQEQSAGTMPQ